MGEDKDRGDEKLQPIRAMVASVQQDAELDTRTDVTGSPPCDVETGPVRTVVKLENLSYPPQHLADVLAGQEVEIVPADAGFVRRGERDEVVEKLQRWRKFSFALLKLLRAFPVTDRKEAQRRALDALEAAGELPQKTDHYARSELADFNSFASEIKGLLDRLATDADTALIAGIEQARIDATLRGMREALAVATRFARWEGETDVDGR